MQIQSTGLLGLIAASKQRQRLSRAYTGISTYVRITLSVGRGSKMAILEIAENFTIHIIREHSWTIGVIQAPICVCSTLCIVMAGPIQ